MALQLSSFAHRAAEAGAWLLPPDRRPVPGEQPVLDLPDDVPAHAAARARLALVPPARERYDLLLERAAAPGSVPGAVLGRALTAGRSLAAVEGLAAAWPRSEDGRRAATDPLTLAEVGAQRSGVTCGSAVVTMLAALGDPFLAWWVATGERVGPVPELAAAPPAVLHRLAVADQRARLGALHGVLHARLVRGALGPFDWPVRFGTPPWALARAARFLDVRYRAVAADDTDRAHQEDLLDRVRDAVGRGVPVPLFSGGDTSRGLDAAVPRHVTLAVAATDEGLEVFDPAGGALRTVTWDALVTGEGVGRALGGWPHLSWVVLPRPSSY